MIVAGIALLVLGVAILAVTQICLHSWLKKYKESWEGYHDMQ